MNKKPCIHCRQPIIVARKAEKAASRRGEKGVWTVLDAEPVTPASVMDASSVRLLSGIDAYRLEHLKEVLTFRRDISSGAAHDMAAEDFPWHTIHHCEREHDHREAAA